MPAFLPRLSRPALCTAALLLAAPLAAAAPAAPDYALTVDARRAFASPMGQLIMDRIRVQEPRLDEWMNHLTDTLGLDVRTDVGVMSLASSSDDLSDLSVVADLGESAGKLEGWMLTLPSYNSEDLDPETLLHTFEIEEMGDAAPPDDTLRSVQEDGTAALFPERPTRSVRVFATLPQTRDGHTCLIASASRDTTLAMTAAARAGEGGPITDAADKLRGDRLLALTVNRLPAQLLADTADQPGAAAWRAIRGMQLNLTSSERFRADLDLTAASPARGRQLKQLLGGLNGLVQLMATTNDQAGVGEMVSLLSDIDLDDRTDGTPGVAISLDVPQARIASWIDRGLMPVLRQR